MKLLVAICLIVGLNANSYSQVEKSSDLYQALRINDSLLFDVGFNTCDIKQFDSLLSDRFEFYHDEAGNTSSKSDFIASIRDGLCKLNYKPRRQLAKGTLKVYPLKKNAVLYGAIQTGKHEFYGREEGKPEYLTSTATFSHLWLIEDGKWKLSRVFSYDHQVPRRAGE